MKFGDKTSQTCLFFFGGGGGVGLSVVNCQFSGLKQKQASDGWLQLQCITIQGSPTSSEGEYAYHPASSRIDKSAEYAAQYSHV